MYLLLLYLDALLFLAPLLSSTLRRWWEDKTVYLWPHLPAGGRRGEGLQEPHWTIRTRAEGAQGEKGWRVEESGILATPTYWRWSSVKENNF